jgi:hypothetical protein
MAKMSMKKSDIIKELLAAYHKQEGSRANWEVIHKAGKIIKKFEQKEAEALTASNKLRVSV